MERIKQHRRHGHDNNEESFFSKPIFPWSDGLISWDGVDHLGDRGCRWQTPSMTSGSSQPSTSNFAPEAELNHDFTRTSSFDSSLAVDASDAHELASDQLSSTSDELFPKFNEQDISGISQYNSLSYSALGFARVRQTSNPTDTWEPHYGDCDRNKSVSAGQRECSEEDDSIAAVVTRALPNDLPLAAHLIPILHKNYCADSHASIREKVGAWREDITNDDKHLQTPTASRTSDAEARKRSRNPGLERDEDEDEDEGGDDEDNRKPKKVKGTSERDQADSIPRLACPFHKKDPNKYNIQFDEAMEGTGEKTKKTEYRACAGPGFKNIQRLKEHLKRKHYPVQCDRCYEIFPNSRATAITALEAHRQLPIPCDRKPASFKEGISDAQWAQLDKKTSNKDNISTSAVEKWNHIWCVLFPDTPVPSTPWYEGVSRELTLPNGESHHFLDLFKQMLDHQVSHRDIQFAEASEDTMKSRVVSLVGKAFKLYSDLNGSSPTTSISSRGLEYTSSSGSAMHPVFSIANNRRDFRSTMSSTSAPSSAISVSSPESTEGTTCSPTTLNITSNPTFVESPLRSSDLDSIPPRTQQTRGGMNVVAHRAMPSEKSKEAKEEAETTMN